MDIRDEHETDSAEIGQLLAAAFGGADEARLVERLRRDGDAVLALVALAGGAIVGHVVFSVMTAPFRGLALAPLAVLPSAQRTGIGSALVEAGIERARQAGWQAVFVLGDPAYYGRFGFRADLAEGFSSPYAGPHLMALATAGRLPVLTGPISHAPAFAGLG
jgi:putative acetyltransferase